MKTTEGFTPVRYAISIIVFFLFLVTGGFAALGFAVILVGLPLYHFNDLTFPWRALAPRVAVAAVACVLLRAILRRMWNPDVVRKWPWPLR